ncbi:hypothetical protein BOX15_Mlig008333g1 [Macrostomum lignano]|uniref:Nuclear receptor domain-containing protein n=1 Tax=Macrostomum lignano TaxID=282301 RepID=A0A267FGU3_9PLAT|nr:hypothetical protein BOX15_Mlig008333g1 [Macrostomum lignano]
MQHAGHTALLVACPFKQNSCDLDAQHQLKSIQPQKELHFKEEEEQQQQQQQQQHACQCTVCGDKALGYNFDAITCESCKAFFRRNALKTKIQKCNFESSCLVSVITRKFCPACRLAKCFKVGMKREWILNAAQLQMRRQKTLENRRSRQNRQRLQLEQQQQHQEQQHQEHQEPEEPLTVLHLISDPESEQSPGAELVWAQYRRLSGASLSLIKQIERALGDTINGVDQNDSDRILTAAKEGGAAPETPFVITLSFVRRFVKFVKILPEFELIGKQDAGRLIKGGAFNFILMRGVAIYSPDSDSFAFKLASTGGRHSISLSTVAQCLADSPGGQQLMSDYRSFMRNYHEDSRGDQMALTLLQLIDFYNPARPGLSSMRTVDSVQQGYLVLLKRYIDSAWPKHCACNVYFRLLNRLTELESLGQRFGSLCNTVGFRYEELNPLLVELFQQRECACPDCQMKPEMGSE